MRNPQRASLTFLFLAFLLSGLLPLEASSQGTLPAGEYATLSKIGKPPFGIDVMSGRLGAQITAIQKFGKNSDLTAATGFEIEAA